jgi:hypothetical protein
LSFAEYNIVEIMEHVVFSNRLLSRFIFHEQLSCCV